MVKISKLKEMNSCRNWHCCCHTIITKKRRQDYSRFYKSPPSKNLKLDVESKISDPKATNYGATPKVVNTIQFEITEREENEKSEDDGGISHSESDTQESPPFETMSNDGDENLVEASKELGIQSSSPDSLIAKPDESVVKEKKEPPSTCSSVDKIIESGQKIPMTEKDEIKEKETSEEKNVTQNITTLVNGTTEDDATKELNDAQIKPEVVNIVSNGDSPTALSSIEGKSVEIKDKEQPSTSTGSSTGRYNCRNREKFHKCLKCGKMFFQLDSFVRHEKEHLLEETKPCYCTVCNRSYTSMSSFSRHLKTHVTCTQCNKTFSQAEVGKLSPGGQNYSCSDCKKNSSPQPPVLQPEGAIKVGVAVKSNSENANQVPMNNGTTVYARKSVPVFIEKKSESGAVFKKVKKLAGLQSAHPKVSKGTKDHSSFLKCNECDRRFPNLTTLKNHRTLHTVT